jgi:hypothetical protein
VLSTDVTQVRRFATGLDSPNPSFNEAQRADSAPRSTNGDGIINSGDVVQTRRYATGLDPQTPASGPTSPAIIPDALSGLFESIRSFFFGREMSVGAVEAFAGERVEVPIEFTPYGDETALSFTLEYDASRLSNPRVSLADGSPAGASLTVNTNNVGRVGVLIDSSESMIASATPRRIIVVTFDVLDGTARDTAVRLTNSLAPKSVSNGDADPLETRYVDGVVTIRSKNEM